jgi:hypothetical protein
MRVRFNRNFYLKSQMVLSSKEVHEVLAVGVRDVHKVIISLPKGGGGNRRNKNDYKSDPSWRILGEEGWDQSFYFDSPEPFYKLMCESCCDESS